MPYCVFSIPSATFLILSCFIYVGVVRVSELSLESVFGPGHEGVVQTTAFRPSLNQTEITVPAHGDGQFVALDVVIQGLGGQDQVQAPYLLTVKEETCFHNNLPGELNPTKTSSGNTGMMAKKHLIQTNIKRINEGTADYNELPGKVRAKCEGKEIFRGDYKFLSQDQYEESTEAENYIGDSQYSVLSPRTKRGSPHPQCMREHKCAYDGGHGCFLFDGDHIYDGQCQKCVCCKKDCPHSPIENDCNCRDLTAETFLNCYNSQIWYGFPYSSGDTCTSPTNGGWSTWSDWTACFTGLNGNQIRERSRQCDNPEPANGGSDCPGNWNGQKVTERLPCSAPSQGCPQVQLTKVNYDYTYYNWPATSSRLTFEARGSHDVHVLFSFCDGCDGFEIVIGGNLLGNLKSIIRGKKQEGNLFSRLWTETPNILSPTEMRSFWIDIKREGAGVKIDVGKGTEVTGFMSRTWDTMVHTWNPHGSWPPTYVAFAAFVLGPEIEYKFCLSPTIYY